MRIRKKYHAIVVGSALSGLISAALLAKRGFQVLVLNQEQIPWGFSYGGFTIQRESLSCQGFKRHLFEMIFEEVGLKAEERRFFERSQPHYQVILPHHRLDILGNREQIVQECRREFPKSIESIIRFYQTLDETWQKFRMKKARPLSETLPAEFSHKKLNDLFQKFNLPLSFQKNIVAQISFLSHIHTQNPTIAQAAQVLCECNRKDYYFLGDTQQFANILYDRIREAGGSVRDEAFVERFHFSKDQITGARLNTYEGVVEAELYIGNVEIHRFYKLFPHYKTPRNLKQKLQVLRPSFAKCVFFLGVKENLIPVGMKSNVILIQNENAPLIGDNLIFLHLLPKEKNSQKRMIFLSFMLPYPHASEWQDFHGNVQKITEKVIRHVGDLMPFLKENLLLILPNFKDGPSAFSLSGRSLKSFPLLQGIYPLPPQNRRLHGGFTNTTPFKNLFFTGPEIFPALGFEGETLSSLKTANLASRAFQNIQKSWAKHKSAA